MNVVFSPIPAGFLPKDAKPEDKVILPDGTQLLTLSISGTDLLSAVSGFISALVKQITPKVADKKLYLSPGIIAIGTGGARIEMVLGIEGISDLESLIAVNEDNNLLKSEGNRQVVVETAPVPENESSEETGGDIRPVV